MLLAGKTEGITDINFWGPPRIKKGKNKIGPNFGCFIKMKHTPDHKSYKEFELGEENGNGIPEMEFMKKLKGKVHNKEIILTR